MRQRSGTTAGQNRHTVHGTHMLPPEYTTVVTIEWSQTTTEWSQTKFQYKETVSYMVDRGNK